MKFILEGKPIAKQRHRFARGFAYDPQSRTKNKVIKLFKEQFQQQGCLKPLEGAIFANMDIRYPIPSSWSNKRKIEAVGKYVITKPDNDNCEKFYWDCLTKISYSDDAQIAANFTQKRYSDDPGVTVNLTKLGDDMIDEHAITYKDELSIEDLNYLVKKANLLGLSNRKVFSVYEEKRNGETHIYFAVEGMKEKGNG